jgi:predicted Co/Zn/Cd cation transporter (cation efflux family)
MTSRRISTLSWFLIRIVLPWASAMDMLTRGWGKEHVVYALMVSFLVVFHLYVSSGDRPSVPRALQPRGFRALVGFWHLLDGLALLTLFFFEFVTAMVAEMDGGDWWLTFAIITAIYLFPYATLTVLARYLLSRANRLIDRAVADLEA